MIDIVTLLMQVRTVNEISAMEARRQFGELMNRAYYGGESFVIKRDDLPMVKIESVYSDLEKDQAREHFFAFVDEIRQQLALQDQGKVDQAFEEALTAARTQP